MMTKLEAVIQPSRFEAVKEILTEIGIGGMTVTDVRGHGRQKGHTESYRGREYSIDLLPKVKIEMVLAENQVDAAVDAILKTASTGKIGDGKIFLSKVEETIRIRNQERGVVALYPGFTRGRVLLRPPSRRDPRGSCSRGVICKSPPVSCGRRGILTTVFGFKCLQGLTT